MKIVNLIDFSELLSYAETMGYDWDEAHKILDNFYPRYGVRVVFVSDLYKFDIEDEDVEGEMVGEDARKILLSFFDKHKVTEFTIKGE